MGIIACVVFFILCFFYTYKKHRIVDRKDILYYVIANIISIGIFTFFNINIINEFRGILFFAVVPILFSIAWYDAKEKQIDVKLMLVLLGIAILSIISSDIMYTVMHTLTAVLFFIMMFIGNKISKNGIGFGDVKILPILALLLGIEATLKITLGALFIMLGIGIVAIIRKKAKWKDTIPFVPYLYVVYILSTM